MGAHDFVNRIHVPISPQSRDVDSPVWSVCHGIDDDLCTGSRYFLHMTPPEGPHLRRIAKRYLNRVPCPSKHSDSFDRREYLVDMVRQGQADGIVMLILKFCDPHDFDYPDVAKSLTENEIPHIKIETEMMPTSIEQVRTRLQAFVEMLKEKKNG